MSELVQSPCGGGSSFSVIEVIEARRNSSPKRLIEPGPSTAQVEVLVRLAATAPDHGRLVPWRLVIVSSSSREDLARAFELALRDREPDAAAETVASERQKAFRSPLLIAAIAKLGPCDPDVPAAERLVSLGAALQNLMLGAQSLGFSSGLASGRKMGSVRLRQFLRLSEDEKAICFVSVGTLSNPGSARERPSRESFVSTL